jgi:beta-glucosidase
MADMITEPRWNRIGSTFGEDPALVTSHTKAIVEGFQGRQLGPESVMTVTKHFPGDGPVKDGYDGHNAYGKWYIYPGNQFDLHLQSFKAAIESGTGGIMTAYGIPVGKDTVGIAFSKAMVNELLRKKLGFRASGHRLEPQHAVGRRTLSGRTVRDGNSAGVDRSAATTSRRHQATRDGSIPTAVIDTVARRVLPIFQLGLFEIPSIRNAKARWPARSFWQPAMPRGRGRVLLKNADDLLPAAPGKRIRGGISRDAAAAFGTVVDNRRPPTSDPARRQSDDHYPSRRVCRRRARQHGAPPPPPVAPYGITLAYGNAANWQVMENIKKIAATGTKTVVIVNMDKPVILTEFIDDVAGVYGAFGPGDAALLDVVFGKAKVTGKLPFDVPSDMPSVVAQAADVPFDMVDPMFKFGFGLTYKR